MFVSINALGPSMERSTCDSAAKLTTALGLYVDKVDVTSLRQDGAFSKNVLWIVFELREICSIAGIGQRIESNDWISALVIW